MYFFIFYLFKNSWCNFHGDILSSSDYFDAGSDACSGAGSDADSGTNSEPEVGAGSDAAAGAGLDVGILCRFFIGVILLLSLLSWFSLALKNNPMFREDLSQLVLYLYLFPSVH